MFHSLSLLVAVLILVPASSMYGAVRDNGRRIILVAGETARVDKPGHHDYLAGCRLLADLLRQTPGVETVLVANGWPVDESIFDGAEAVVFYTDGGGKQAYLQSASRLARMEALAAAGVGLSFFHQALDYPAEHTARATAWLGGTYVAGKSGRGHWITDHQVFPKHPVMQGVTRWEVFDGWLNGIQFVPDLTGVTPLVWSGKEHQGDPAGGTADIVGWVYERPAGGRSFCFSGLDAHSAWSLEGMRQFVVNGILWSAGMELPGTGAPNRVDEAALKGYLTPRTPPAPKKKAPARKTD